jgi:hypothetical protein
VIGAGTSHWLASRVKILIQPQFSAEEPARDQDTFSSAAISSENVKSGQADT